MDAASPTSYGALLRDVEVVKKYVTGRPDEEILAYLEAHYRDPTRVEKVIKELSGNEDFVLVNEEKRENALPQLDLNDDEVQQLLGINKCCWQQTCTCWSRRNAAQQVDAGFYSIQPSPVRLNEKEKSFYDEQLKILTEILPDGDPDYFSNIVLGNVGNIGFINDTVNSWLQKGNYKKKWKKDETSDGSDVKRKIFERDATVEEFLELFPDPESHFNRYHNVSGSYRRHVIIYVYNTFDMNDSFLFEVFKRLKFQLIPIVRELESYWSDPSSVHYREKQEMPATKDELFYQELTYLKLYKQIKDYEESKKEDRVKKLEEAKLSGSLMTCECCFEDEVFLEDMLACPKDHMFCKDCIRKQAEVNLGLNKLQFPCFNGYCKEQFSMKVLQECLPPKTYSIIVKKEQEEEVRKAGIIDLESCPFCSFSAIMPNLDDKIFKCLNPECLKESCRLCKEPNHVPLRCNEVEKKPEVEMRTYIENKMSDALLRTCPKCNCRFLKTEGCNSMKCTCGQMMCYVCRQPITDYTHFDFDSRGSSNSGKCPLSSNQSELHVEDLRRGAETARSEYLRMHPELANVELKHDPTKHIPIAPPKPKLPAWPTVLTQNENFQQMQQDAFQQAALKRRWPEQRFNFGKVPRTQLNQRPGLEQTIEKIQQQQQIVVNRFREIQQQNLANNRSTIPHYNIPTSNAPSSNTTFPAPPSYAQTNSNSNFLTNSTVTSSAQINRNPPPPSYPVLPTNPTNSSNSSNSGLNVGFVLQTTPNTRYALPFSVPSTSTSTQSNYPPYWESSPAPNVQENTMQQRQTWNSTQWTPETNSNRPFPFLTSLLTPQNNVQNRNFQTSPQPYWPFTDVNYDRN